jgi:hypothetical protein
MPDQKQSILLGAAVAAVLSTSYLGLINCLCCAGVVIAGILTVWHYTDTNQVTVPAGRGAMMGLAAAALGAFVAIFLNFVLIKMGVRADLMIQQLIIDRFGDAIPPEQVDQMRDQMERPVTFVSHLLSGLIGVLVSAIFGAVGGAIGASIFKKGSEPADDFVG